MEAHGRRSRIKAYATSAAVALAVVAALSACGGSSAKTTLPAPTAAGSGQTSGQNPATSSGASSASGGATSAAAAGDAAVISITPSNNAASVDPASLVQVSVANGTLTSVTAQISGGATVPGTLDASGASWSSSAPVGIGHTYGVTAVATGNDGKQQTLTSTFTTPTPTHLLIGTFTPDNGTTVGVAQPVSITFDHPVADKAAVEKGLMVDASPAVAGSWHWFGNQRVDYRPQQYWAPGTKVTLHLRLDGVKSGDAYGKQNKDVSFTIGRSLVATEDVAAKKMTVVVNGSTTVLKTSSGKEGFETWNGTMVVLEKNQDIPMNSSTVGIFGVQAYDIPDVYWTVKLTTSGTFVHAAPWNAGKFGVVNGSHGCIGLSTDDAKWFFGQVIPGDPVTVVNSKDVVRADNGFGDWNLSWADWTAGSALTH